MLYNNIDNKNIISYNININNNNNNNNNKNNNNSVLVSPIYTFSLAANIIAYTPSQGTNRVKYFNHNNHKDENCRLWLEIYTFPSISSLIGCAFSIF